MNINTQRFYGSVTVYHEARGEPLYGQAGVAHVILNRAILRGLTIKEVVYQYKQFSCYNANKQPSITNYEALFTAENMFDRAIEERLYGFDFFGADHYHATYISQPSWARGMKSIVQVGHHIFYSSTG